MQNVTLAVNLARHSTSNWRDAALPDDLAAIEKLLHIKRETLLSRLNIPEEFATQYLADESKETQGGTPTNHRA